MHLSDLEAAALAYRIIGRHVVDTDWLEWEDHPMLDEVSFHMVEEQVRIVGQATLDKSHALDAMSGIDSADLLERVR